MPTPIKPAVPSAKASPLQALPTDSLGMDSESLKNGLLAHLQYTLAELPKPRRQRVGAVRRARADRPRPDDRAVDPDPGHLLRAGRQARLLHVAGVPDGPHARQQPGQPRPPTRRQGAARAGLRPRGAREAEWDAGLGNGGLGRLAACFLDSLATLGFPSYGYGIRYDYGIFHQRIVNGAQVELPDAWLRYGNPWEIARPGDQFPVQFYGRVNTLHERRRPPGQRVGRHPRRAGHALRHADPRLRHQHRQHAPALGRQGRARVRPRRLQRGRLRRRRRGQGPLGEHLPRALPERQLARRQAAAPRQEYFFVSATLQDIIRRYKKRYEMFDEPQGLKTFDRFAEKVAIQLNDTHPALAIPELMRLLIDVEGLGWDEAWDITTKTLRLHEPHRAARGAGAVAGRPVRQRAAAPPADHLRDQPPLPRQRPRAVPRTTSACRRMSIIEEGGEQRVRMATLAIVGSHSVNGVAALHSEILKNALFRDFYEMWPEKFNNKTNGITQRRWLLKCNPGLARLIIGAIGDGWIDRPRPAGEARPRSPTTPPSGERGGRSSAEQGPARRVIRRSTSGAGSPVHDQSRTRCSTCRSSASTSTSASS